VTATAMAISVKPIKIAWGVFIMFSIFMCLKLGNLSDSDSDMLYVDDHSREYRGTVVLVQQQSALWIVIEVTEFTSFFR
jgi:hypothetical protein